MNIKEYISSGILEAYVLDELPSGERAEVEKNLAMYPQLRVELVLIEKTLEGLMQQASIAPRAQLKNNILSSIEEPKQGKVISINKVSSVWRWAAAASVAFAITASYLAFDYRDKWISATIALNTLIDSNQQIAQDYDKVNQRLDKIQGDFSIIENTAFSRIVLKGTENSPTALASVYWNASSQEVFLSIQRLKEISSDNQFQLWALVEGKPVDMGVFDSGFDGLRKMKTIANPGAFAITIEPRGGKPNPTLETLQVIGNVAKG
ncbi:MAG: anti-sigma factor [Cyclobacteriaceae bacterium]|nr:anti-sigma factor [Cyclobacteriaceae bacterium]